METLPPVDHIIPFSEGTFHFDNDVFTNQAIESRCQVWVVWVYEQSGWQYFSPSCYKYNTVTAVYIIVSHLSPPSPCAWWRVLHRLFHLSRSVAHSSLILHYFMSILTVSSHLNLGLHIGRFPPSSFRQLLMFSVSSLLLTWPKHSSLLLLITVAICSTFASSKISSFLRCSNRLTPLPIASSHLCCCHTHLIFD